MCRRMCLVLVLILCGGGCGRKSTPPQAPMPKTGKTSQAPAARTPTRAAQVPQKDVAPQPPVVISPTEAKDPVAAARLFLHAITTAQYDRAVALTVPGKFTAQGFMRMALTFQMEKAFLNQAWAGSKVAAVVTDLVPTKQGAVAGAVWGLKLVPTEGGHWSVRDMDVLPNGEAADKYLAAFREGEPDAKSVPL